MLALQIGITAINLKLPKFLMMLSWYQSQTLAENSSAIGDHILQYEFKAP
jgi:hypothetical protein